MKLNQSQRSKELEIQQSFSGMNGAISWPRRVKGSNRDMTFLINIGTGSRLGQADGNYHIIINNYLEGDNKSKRGY